MALNPRWDRHQRVLLASVESDWKDEDGDEHDTDIAAALELLVDRYQTDIAPHNSRLPPGNGMADFAQPTEAVANDE